MAVYLRHLGRGHRTTTCEQSLTLKTTRQRKQQRADRATSILCELHFLNESGRKRRLDIGRRSFVLCSLLHTAIDAYKIA